MQPNGGLEPLPKPPTELVVVRLNPALPETGPRNKILQATLYQLHASNNGIER